MTARRTSQLLIIFAALFGVLAFVCACGAARRFPVHGSRFPVDYPNGPTLEDWMRAEGIPFRVVPFIEAEEETGIPKLTEP